MTLSEDEKLAQGGDRAAMLRVANNRMTVGQWDAARVWLERCVETLPEDRELHDLLARVVKKLAPKQAWQYFERAVELAPNDDALLRELVNALVAAGEYGQAADRYGQLYEEEKRVEDLIEQARALHRVQRYEEAARVWDRVFELHPEKQKVATYAFETMSARRAAKLPVRPEQFREATGRGRRQNRIGLAVIGTLILVASVAAAVLAHRTRVVVDNHSRTAFSLRLDGEPWGTVPAGSHAVLGAWRGKHQVELEPGKSFEVDWTYPIWEGLGPTTFVLDPEELGVYEIYEVGYGCQPSHGPVYHYCERSFYAGPVNHVFEPPPRTIQLEKGKSEIRRVLVRVGEGSAGDVADALLAAKRPQDAVRYLERTLERSAEDEELLYKLDAAGDEAGEGDAVHEWIEKHLAWTRAAVTFHRYRQDLAFARGDAATLASYRDAPKDAVGAYLRGRAAPTSAEALDRYARASELDPELSWPWLDSGLEYLDRGEGDEAIRRIQKFLELRKPSRFDRQKLWEALAIAGRWEELVRALNKAREDSSELSVRAEMLVASDAPEARWREVRAIIDQKFPGADWAWELDLDRALWTRDANGARVLVLAHPSGNPAVDGTFAAAVELATGDLAKAHASLHDVFTHEDVPGRALHLALLLGIAEEWAGGDGSGWYKLAADLAPARDEQEIARFLEGRLGADELAAGDRRRPPDSRAISRLARALRASGAERHRLLSEAEKFGLWRLSDTVFLVRNVLAR